jgi:hypothetical protein
MYFSLNVNEVDVSSIDQELGINSDVGLSSQSM